MRGSVIYYSRTGNTKVVAEKIAEKLGFNLIEIKELKNRTGLWGWLNAGKDATLGSRTKISPEKLELSEIDLVVLCSPVWAFSPVPAMVECIRKNSFKGKKIYLVLTSDGMPGKAAERFQKEVLASGGELLGVKHISARDGIEQLKMAAADFSKNIIENS